MQRIPLRVLTYSFHWLRFRSSPFFGYSLHIADERYQAMLQNEIPNWSVERLLNVEVGAN
jgi:hypothetical protein